MLLGYFFVNTIVNWFYCKMSLVGTWTFESYFLTTNNQQRGRDFVRIHHHGWDWENHLQTETALLSMKISRVQFRNDSFIPDTNHGAGLFTHMTGPCNWGFLCRCQSSAIHAHRIWEWLLMFNRHFGCRMFPRYSMVLDYLPTWLGHVIGGFYVGANLPLSMRTASGNHCWCSTVILVVGCSPDTNHGAGLFTHMTGPCNWGFLCRCQSSAIHAHRIWESLLMFNRHFGCRMFPRYSMVLDYLPTWLGHVIGGFYVGANLPLSMRTASGNHCWCSTVILVVGCSPDTNHGAGLFTHMTGPCNWGFLCRCQSSAIHAHRIWESLLMFNRHFGCRMFPRYEPWCWNIYPHDWAVFLGFLCRCQSSSTMVRIWVHGYTIHVRLRKIVDV